MGSTIGPAIGSPLGPPVARQWLTIGPAIGPPLGPPAPNGEPHLGLTEMTTLTQIPNGGPNGEPLASPMASPMASHWRATGGPNGGPNGEPPLPPNGEPQIPPKISPKLPPNGEPQWRTPTVDPSGWVEVPDPSSLPFFIFRSFLVESGLWGVGVRFLC